MQTLLLVYNHTEVTQSHFFLNFIWVSVCSYVSVLLCYGIVKFSETPNRRKC